MDFTTLARLEMEIKDVDGMEIPLFFYTSGRGSEIVPSQVTRGYTVVSLYPRGHAFMYSEPGIRLENPALIKVLCHTPYQSLPTGWRVLAN